MSLHIQTSKLYKTYMLDNGRGEKHAVADATLTIHEGERVGIIGRNGAGKTTLLQMLSGISSPSAGTLDVNGKVTAIFTLGLGLRDDVTGRENIYLDGELHGRTREETEALVEPIIAFAELGAFIDRPVRTYSTGMKARLAFAMLAHIEPEILIIDEALSVGDASFAAKATAKMRELASRGRILIVVSHSMGAIVDMCTRCIWMDEGTVRMDGDPKTVTEAYIDEVRAADEHELMQRFSHQLINESLVEGFAIPAMHFTRGGSAVPLSVLQTGEDTALHLTLTAPAHSMCHVVLEFFRLDGVRVCISHSHAVQIRAEGALTLAASLGALPLNHGLYAVRAALYAGAALMARNTVCIEVLNPAPPKGGRPLLITPSFLTSEKVSS